MPTSTNTPEPLPLKDLPMTDPKTGKPTPAFYDWLRQFYIGFKGVRQEIP